jgi:DNA polymerase III subunit epsilon
VNIGRPIVWLDFETTGVDPVKDRIVECAFVALYPDGNRKEWFGRLNPGIPIPAEATVIHGITDADVADCPPFEAVAKKIVVGLAGKDLGGYNLRRLDLPILDEELRRRGLKLDLSGVRIIDCAGIFFKREPRALEDAVRKYCGREHTGAHGALADAQATLDVFMGQRAAYPDLAAQSLDEIATYSRLGDVEYADIAGKLYRKDGQVYYAFGKHKDKRVLDEPGYGEWMLRSAFAGSTCDVLREVLGIRAEDADPTFVRNGPGVPF